MQMMGKTLVVFGVVAVIVGVLLTFSEKIPFLGKLPGDIVIKRDGFRLFIPVTTSILVSVLISIILWIFSTMKGK